MSKNRTVAEGNLSKLVYILVGGLIVIGVATYLEPWTQEYEIKTGVKLTCGELFKSRFHFDKPNEFFIGKATRAGVRFEASDNDPDCETRIQKDAHCFNIFAEHDKAARQFRCVATVRYQTTTPAAFVGHVLQELPPLVLSHHIYLKQEIADRW